MAVAEPAGTVDVVVFIVGVAMAQHEIERPGAVR